MTPSTRTRSTARRTRRALSCIVLVAAVLGGGTGAAHAAVTCPHANPVVNENNCAGAGTTAYRLTNYSENLAGYSTKTSFNRGEAVPLKIARSTTGTRVNVAVYRMGYYGGTGGRLIPAAGATNVPVGNSFACNAADAHTGLRDCGNWGVSYTIPGSALPVSGVYVAKLTSADAQALQNWIIFTVRDDQRVTPAKALFVLPVASYQAYNTWGG
ncbi:MAG: dmfA2 1, partial [Solirubrobacterales bacterium]|nr:dmfA2 1 [Solirubrobacterales bacterium]